MVFKIDHWLMISFSFAHFTNAAFASFASLWVCKSVPERVQLISILIIRSQSHHHHHHFNARSLFEAQRKFKNLTFYDMMHLIFHHCISLSFLHLFSLSVSHTFIFSLFFLKQWANPRLLFVYFQSFQTNNTIFRTNQCE